MISTEAASGSNHGLSRGEIIVMGEHPAIYLPARLASGKTVVDYYLPHRGSGGPGRLEIACVSRMSTGRAGDDHARASQARSDGPTCAERYYVQLFPARRRSAPSRSDRRPDCI